MIFWRYCDPYCIFSAKRPPSSIVGDLQILCIIIEDSFELFLSITKI